MKLEKKFQVKIKRTSRKRTISLEVKEGYVQVLVPNVLSEKEIERIIDKKTKWIRSKLLLQKSKPIYKAKEFISGELFLYLGKNYRLKIIESKLAAVKLRENTIYVFKRNKGRSVHGLLVNWYKAQALKLFEKKINEFSKIMRVNPKSISTKTYSKRWGSCSSKGDISFNWRILMAPNTIIDYVVIHELCHLIHHDHSPRYWRTVKSFCPDYKEKAEWLRNNSTTLAW